MPNIKFPNPIDSKLQESLLRDEKKEESKVNYSNNDSKKKNSLYYSNTIDTFLSHYFSAMNNAPPPKEVVTVKLEAIKNASNSSDYLFRYMVGEVAKIFAREKKDMSNSQLYKFISDKLLR